MRCGALGAMGLLLFCAPFTAGAKTPFTFEELMKLIRIDNAVLSPDGKAVAFTAQTVDLPNNKKPEQIYIVPTDGAAPPVALTHEGDVNDRPKWSPDGKRLYFVSGRSNGSQIWSMNPDGTDQRAITALSTEAADETISPDGKLVVFKSDVYPDCAPAGAKPGVIFDAACNQANLAQENAAHTHVHIATKLLYRHWTEYEGSRRTHLLLLTLDGSNTIRDMTPGSLSIPPFALGGLDAYVFSPDSQQLTYVAKLDAQPANSTNSDIYTVPVAGGDAKQLTINPGADEEPVYSPDGKYLAYRTQIRSGYESDQWKLAILNLQTSAMNTLTDSLDKWVEEYTWSPDSQRIFFTIDDHGANPLLMLPVDGGALRMIAQAPSSISNVQFSRDNKMMLYTEQSGAKPNEIYKALSSGGAGIPLTHMNDTVLNADQLTPLEQATVDQPDGAKVQSFIVKPYAFDPSKKYPVLLLIHGGPEGDWGESWTYRWNAQVFAAAGYVVVEPNPRGSVGYGQAFTDAVNGDWGGRPYADILAVADYVANLPYVDKDRMVAAGGSYGGYMIDWILGHTDRFKALVSHAGVYDLVSEAGTTDELWFPKWEFQDFPWESPDLYAKWSPDQFVKSFKTPTLVTQGDIDYRVPVGQSEELFTALQQMNIPSKLVEFPDEGHWILKPQNSQIWYSTVIDWLNHYTQATPASSQ